MATSGYKDSVLHRSLSRAFHRSGLTQQELADRLEVKQQTVSGWMSGTARPAAERFPAIEAVLGLDAGTLYETLTHAVDRAAQRGEVDGAEGLDRIVARLQAYADADEIPEHVYQWMLRTAADHLGGQP